VVPWGAGTAQAAVYPGALRLTVTKVVAGAAGDTLGWTYQVPLPHPVTGTISLDVPAAFTAPQTSAPGAAGYVATTSGCAQFQVTGTTPQHDGSTMITVAVTCAKGLTGAISYTPGTVPVQAGTYVFAATFTPAAGTAQPFTQGDIVAVQHGPLARLVISPASATIATGGTQTYTVQGLDAFGNPLGDLTGGTKFTISPDGSCGRSVCTASVNGPHTITASRQPPGSQHHRFAHRGPAGGGPVRGPDRHQLHAVLLRACHVRNHGHQHQHGVLVGRGERHRSRTLRPGVPGGHPLRVHQL
jgi:hypothetical protein